MRIKKQAIQEYQELFQTEFGEGISYEEAERQGQKFVTLLSLLAKE